MEIILRKYKAREICEEAQRLSDFIIGTHSMRNAERILKLAWEKTKAKKQLLEKKYGK